MAVFPHGVSQRLPAGIGASENFQFAAAVIVKPLDAPLTGYFAIFKDFRWF
jgi:hypothetical protein